MSIDAGDANCTTGLSKKIIDQWAANDTWGLAGYPAEVLAQSLVAQKKQAWALASAIAAQVNEDNAPVFCFAQQTAIQSIPSGAWTPLYYNNITAETTHPSAFTGTGTSQRWFCPKGGTYLLMATCTILSLTSASESLMDLFVGGSTLFRGSVLNPNGGAGVNYKGNIAIGTARIAFGTEVYAGMLQTAGGNRNTSSFWGDGYFLAVRMGD